ncbi:MAG: HD domain-containing protein [Chitinispirillales bacterium]|jgi:predicted hydrolase (HD superfamily)|nr:HD domain-containing protein [Chitinispirillales bacterium]
MPNDFDSIKQWYDRYTGSFSSADEETEGALRLKEQHCKRVMGEIIDIARSLDLSHDEKDAAAIAGLLHDIGRFEQFVKYHTFLDVRSVNHAELAVSIIKKENVLDGLSKSKADSILQAVGVHNKARIPSDSPILCKMLRDADKLDIWNVVLLHFESGGSTATRSVELDFPDIDTVSGNVLSAILRSVPWEIKAMASVNDFKLLVMSWVFDINFAHSFNRIIERNYLPRLFATLPQTAECRQAFEHCVRRLE